MNARQEVMRPGDVPVPSALVGTVIDPKHMNRRPGKGIDLTDRVAALKRDRDRLADARHGERRGVGRRRLREQATT